MPRLGQKQSDETKEKIRIAHTGVPLSEQHKKQISDTHKKMGTIPPSRTGMSITSEHKRRISDALSGRKKGPLSEKIKEKIGLKLKGVKHPEWRCINKSIRQRGSASHLWRGGITDENLLIRNSLKYQHWRLSVFRRDDFTCMGCGDNSGRNLNAHHKRSFSLLMEEARAAFPDKPVIEASILYKPLWDIDNGVTLCETRCHKENQYKQLDGQIWDQYPKVEP